MVPKVFEPMKFDCSTCFICRYFDDDPPYKDSDSAENDSEHKTEQHKIQAMRPEFEAIPDRFTSLEEVSQEIRAKGLDTCGLIFGMLY